jgi:hypothetical protein
MYINTQTLTQHTEQDIRADNPNTSFPVPFVAPDGYAYVFPAPAVYDPVTQTATETTPEQTVLGHWEQRWTVTDKTPEVIAAEAEAKRIAAIPASVSPRQIRQALTRAGLRTSVEAAVAAGDQDTKDWYEFATAFDRASPVVAALGVALSVSPTQLDDLWTLAATL